MPRDRRLNKIGRRKRTEGTETSQYLQERKATATSLVVASERERAQTELHVQARARCAAGVVGFTRTGVRPGRGVNNPSSSRTAWEGRP
jgi:hypothetical protein